MSSTRSAVEKGHDHSELVVGWLKEQSRLKHEGKLYIEPSAGEGRHNVPSTTMDVKIRNTPPNRFGAGGKQGIGVSLIAKLVETDVNLTVRVVLRMRKGDLGNGTYTTTAKDCEGLGILTEQYLLYVLANGLREPVRYRLFSFRFLEELGWIQPFSKSDPEKRRTRRRIPKGNSIDMVRWDGWQEGLGASDIHGVDAAGAILKVLKSRSS